MKAWLKGGLIGGIWGLLGLLFYSLFFNFNTQNPIIGILFLIISFPLSIGKLVIYYLEMLIRDPVEIINVGGPNFISIIPNWLSLILSLIVLIALSCLVGWIIGKVRSRK